jgi:transposase
LSENLFLTALRVKTKGILFSLAQRCILIRHRLLDDEWDLIGDLLPPPSNVGRPRNNPRDMMDGILWILRTGAPWRALPASLGNWSSVWDAVDRWNSDGTLARVLSGAIDQELWLVDGTFVRAARCAAGGGKKYDLLMTGFPTKPSLCEGIS